MSFPQRSLSETRNRESTTPSASHLQGYRLALARITWLIIVVPSFVLFVTSLALAYVALVIGLQILFHDLTGRNQLALVGSTLVIAALFQPLRRRIQAYIDRRFYRRKYDIAKTLAAFSATLRDEVELNDLREQLLAVVQETMQPAHVSLWLRPTEQEARRAVLPSPQDSHNES